MAGEPRLQGKVALVTGAGSRGDGIGNGRAAAILFAREGARVVLADQDLAAAEATQAMIAAEGGEAVAVRADVTNIVDCRDMVAEAVDRWGRLDILDNNVGIGGAGSVVDVDQEDWEQVLQVNVTGMMLASKYAVRAMREGSGGSIINISSVSALRPRGLTPYSTSKGAVIALSQAMAVDHAPDGIRVNCIAPGPVYTPMVAEPRLGEGRAEGMSAEVREMRRRASLLQIEGTGWDVGYAALFLASDEARYITGVVLPVDGGVLLKGPSR